MATKNNPGKYDWLRFVAGDNVSHIQAFKMGMRYAAKLVRDHWNDSLSTVNQKDQAYRSANSIENHASLMTEEQINKVVKDND